jgi:hypothetical protein
MNPSDVADPDSLESDSPFFFGTAEPRLSYRPIWNVQQKAMAIYLCELSPAPAGPAEAAAPGHATLGRADNRLLHRAIAGIERMPPRRNVGSLSIPVHHATLTNAACRNAFAAQCGAIAPALRALLVWEIVGTPPDAGERDLFSMVSTLKPYGRAIFLRSRLAKVDFDIPAAVGVHSIGIDLGETMESETRVAARLEKFAEKAHRAGLRSHVHGLTTSSMSLAAVSSGFHYLSGDAICASAEAPWGVLPFDAERLFLHRHAGG